MSSLFFRRHHLAPLHVDAGAEGQSIAELLVSLPKIVSGLRLKALQDIVGLDVVLEVNGI